jgi:hypothetical protein
MAGCFLFFAIFAGQEGVVYVARCNARRGTPGAEVRVGGEGTPVRLLVPVPLTGASRRGCA